MIELPKSSTGIAEMCSLLNNLGIKPDEYTDCTILYNVTFEQLRFIYNLGKDYNLELE